MKEYELNIDVRCTKLQYIEFHDIMACNCMNYNKNFIPINRRKHMPSNWM